MALALLEFIIMVLIIYVLINQIIIPIVKQTKIFPMFNEQHILEKEITEQMQEFENIRMELKDKLVTLDVHKRKQLLMELLSTELNKNIVL